MSKKYIDRIQFFDELDKKSYLHNLPVVKYLKEKGGLTFSHPVTFFVGENGTGKSTLLEAIAVAYGFNPEGGTKNYTFSTNNTHSSLHNSLTLERSAYAKDGYFLRAESFYNVSTYLEYLDEIPSTAPPIFEYYGGDSLHHQSHGESFLALVENRFSGDSLYLLDEPEAALSPTRLLTLLGHIHNLVEKNAQFIISTHSPILMAYPGAEIYELSKEGISSVTYKQTEHYQLTRRFLENPDQFFSYLFKE